MNLNLTQDLELIQLVLQAGLVVKIVLGILVLASLLSWWYIFIKM